jgi:hypothetical protein
VEPALQVTPVRWFAAFLLTLLLLGMGSQCAMAQEHHHSFHEDFYKTWKQPNSTASCCNARIEKNGKEEGDCEPTQARLGPVGWQAWLRQESRWIDIPDDRIIREKNPTQGGVDSHLCWNWGRVLCFVPPTGAM